MIRHLCNGLATLAALAVVSPLVAAEPPNPGFEDGKDGALAAWSLDGRAIPDKDSIASATGVRVFWDTGSAGDGKRCLRLEGDAGAVMGRFKNPELYGDVTLVEP